MIEAGSDPRVVRGFTGVLNKIARYKKDGKGTRGIDSKWTKTVDVMISCLIEGLWGASLNRANSGENPFLSTHRAPKAEDSLFLSTCSKKAILGKK